MRRWLAICGLCSVLSIAQVHAADHGTANKRVSWSVRDTAAYVVSTLNLLRSPQGRPLSALLTDKLNVSGYIVYADQQVDELYFIELQRSAGGTAGALAYKLGWVRPMGLTDSVVKLGAPAAPDAIVADYRNDRKELLYAFTSTLPR